MNFSADLIDERVWLGNFEATEETFALESINITHILSVIESDVPVSTNNKFIHKHIRVEDLETTDLLIEFDSCYNFIDNALSSNPQNNVLIHCLAGLHVKYSRISFSKYLFFSGVSRSATISCMWLMRRHQLSAIDALERLKLARPCVRPNPSFLTQLYFLEQMNNKFDHNHDLYKEFQLERARLIYIDHDTENEGLEKKNYLREQFRKAFALPYGHASCTITETYTCRQCHRELFTNADLSRHTKGSGLYDWFMKHSEKNKMNSSSRIECHENFFTNYLEWLLVQIDTPENSHSASIKCPECSTIIGTYDLNGMKCLCGRWVIPGIHFVDDKIEKKSVTEVHVETTNISQ